MPTREQMTASIRAKLQARTGRSLEEWLGLVRESGIEGDSARRRWLKNEHGLSQNTQWVIVQAAAEAEGRIEATPEELIAAQYDGAKAALHPIYARLSEAAQAFGPDVSLDVRKTYVSLARGRQFALVQPTTRTRVDLGLRLDDVPAGTDERLQPAGSFGSGNITHRVGLTSVDEVDDAVLGWLRSAYEQGA